MVTDMVNSLVTYIISKKFFETTYKYQAPVATTNKKQAFAVVAAPNQVIDDAAYGDASKRTLLRLSVYSRCTTASVYPVAMDDLIKKVHALFPYTVTLPDKRTITYEVQSTLPPVFDNTTFFMYNIILRTNLNY